MSQNLASHLNQTDIALRRSTRLITTSQTIVERSTSILPEKVSKRKRTAKKVLKVEEPGTGGLTRQAEGVTTIEESDTEDTKPKKKARKLKPKADDSVEFTDTTKKLKNTRTPKPEPVYVIPDVEKKETTFKGRLGELFDRHEYTAPIDFCQCSGYACLNTVLRNKKPATESVFCSRTCRYENPRMPLRVTH